MPAIAGPTTRPRLYCADDSAIALGEVLFGHEVGEHRLERREPERGRDAAAEHDQRDDRR